MLLDFHSNGIRPRELDPQAQPNRAVDAQELGGERETFIFKVPPGRLPPPLVGLSPSSKKSMCVCSATCPRTVANERRTDADGGAALQVAREGRGSERASDGFFSSAALSAECGDSGGGGVGDGGGGEDHITSN